MSESIKTEGTKFANVTEKELNPMSGFAGLFIAIISLLASIGIFIGGIVVLCMAETIAVGVILVVLGCIVMVAAIILFCGLHIVNPNEALVLTVFGKYYGTIKKSGFFFTNPFATAFNPTAAPMGLTQVTGTNGQSSSVNLTGGSKKISTKTMTLNNEKQKVNDALGNPIVIGAVVIWRVADPTKAVFNVENYKRFLSTQCDSIIRNNARLYPYDTMEDDYDEKTLRGSSQEIAESMRLELQEKVNEAGLEIKEVRITHLAYSDEIASAMLQRQQAVAIIAARQKIVEGAVSMVKMAIDQLGEEEVVVLDEERKAAMVSNLLVVLCGNKDAQPIVNSGSIY